nr:uncharacterized protein I203_05520 [Kwoniella mangroviensis CBS 8507]OCF65274.1 hypothetical protein I203_05520 [Kwoniella mangroviensis CBS 8507]
MQRYQPPHARQRQRNGQSQYQTRAEAQNGRQDINADSYVRPDRGPGPRSGSGSYSEGYNENVNARLSTRDDRSYTHNIQQNDQYRQQRPNSSSYSRYTINDRPGLSTYNYTSKKDWSTIPSKNTSKNDGVFASPAGDIKPMRLNKIKKFDLDSNKDDGEFDFELVQSVSRSGGDGKEGDLLKDWEIQEKYREFIEKKITKHHSTFNTTYHKAPKPEAKDEIESLGSIVLLFRKLREGVVASGRIDTFAIEVFESSARFSILANNRPQLISSLSGLVPGLYKALNNRYDNGKVNPNSESVYHSHSHSQNGEEVDQQLNNLSICEEEKKKKDGRKEFIILFLLYQLVIIGENEFWSNYHQLTQSSRKKKLNRPFDDITSNIDDFKNFNQIERNGTTESPFVAPSSIALAVNIARIISPDQFDPIRYFQLFNTQTTEYEKVILSWGEDRIRQRAWEVLKKAYMACSIEWAVKFLGLNEGEVERWVEERGGKVEGGLVKLR